MQAIWRAYSSACSYPLLFRTSRWFSVKFNNLPLLQGFENDWESTSLDIKEDNLLSDLLAWTLARCTPIEVLYFQFSYVIYSMTNGCTGSTNTVVQWLQMRYLIDFQMCMCMCVMWKRMSLVVMNPGGSSPVSAALCSFVAFLANCCGCIGFRCHVWSLCPQTHFHLQ